MSTPSNTHNLPLASNFDDFFGDLDQPTSKKPLRPEGINAQGLRMRSIKLVGETRFTIPSDATKAEDIGLTLPEDVITELTDPEFYGMFHYSYRASRQGCKGPICRRFGADQQRYVRRVSGIRRAIERKRPYIERNGKVDLDARKEMTELIVALMVSSERVLPHHLVSVCDRDGVEIPPGALMYEEERNDIMPPELMESFTKQGLTLEGDAKAPDAPMIRNPPEELLPVLAWLTTRQK
jgi:hypothetical protein